MESHTDVQMYRCTIRINRVSGAHVGVSLNSIHDTSDIKYSYHPVRSGLQQKYGDFTIPKRRLTKNSCELTSLKAEKGAFFCVCLLHCNAHDLDLLKMMSYFSTEIQ